MILIEQAEVPETDLPVAEFRDHLQLGSGFADDGLQDAVLVAQLRAALAFVEGKTSKALLERIFLLVIHAWRNPGEQVLPLAPVSAITEVSVTDLTDAIEVVDVSAYRLKVNAHAPVVLSTGFALPTIPVGGTADITFRAGFGSWSNVPADLRQAVLLAAAHFYENRSATGTKTVAMPVGVDAICRRHAPIRLVGARRI